MACGVNEWLRSFLPLEVVQDFPEIRGHHDSLSSPAALAQFREFVLQNLGLQTQLREIGGHERLFRKRRLLIPLSALKLSNQA